MIGTKTAGVSPLVVVGTGTGVTLIPSPTQLTRLNYFDGKFLRAEDLSAEQAYLRSLVQLSNQAGGAGVVHGFDTRLGTGGALELGPGLGIDRAGRVLFLPHPTSVGVAELIEKSRNPAGGGGAAKKAGTALFGGCAEPAAGPPPATSVLPAELYLVVLGHAEALCGEEDVYGKLCEDACSPDTNRRFRVEGVVLRAVPVSLDPPTTPFPNAARKHLRSLAASAYFATERARLGREMSGARLRQDLWCHPAPLEHWPTEAGEGIPLALLSVTGGTVEWLDMWTARRDRMEPPPRKGWAWQMMMRPWEVFLAQVLQFQCQLTDLLAGTPPGGGPDPCEENRRILERARAILERIERRYDSAPETVVVVQPAQPVEAPAAAMPAPPAAMAELSARRSAALQKEVAGIAQAGQTGQVRQARPEYLPELAELRKEILVALDEGAPGSARVLVDGGIVELPAAGYLPVVPGREVDEQVRQLLGDGVDLRFCAVRPDYVAHALEEAQHMDRIGLLQGLEDPAKRPEVDVLVPDGEVVEKPVAPAGRLFEVTVRRATKSKPSVGSPTVGAQQPAAGTGTGDGEDGEGGYDDEARVLLRGAGRGQRLAGGGGAFHFAGVSGLLGRVSIPSNPTVGGTGDTASTADATLRSFAAGGAGAGTGFRVPRVPGIGEALGWMFGGARAAKPAAEEAQADTADAAPGDATAAAGTKRRMGARELRQVAAPKLSAPSLENVTLGVWVSLRCEGDPFALEAGESVPVRAEAVVGIDGVVIDGEPVPAWARGRIVGDLVCRVPADGGSRMRARLEGAAFGRTRKLGDSADGDGSGDTDGSTDGSGDQEGSAPLDIPVDLELRPVLGGGSELVATLYVPNDAGLLAVSVATSWRGSPVLAQSVAAMDLLATVNEMLKTATGDKREQLLAMKKMIEEGRFPATMPVLAATARENPAVADAGNAYHGDAVRALKALGRVLEDPGFREGAERLLFPPPPRQSGTARVRATRDWVLFHRRRRSSCDCCPGAAVAAPPRRYRVYHAALDDDPSPEEIREALAGDDPPGNGDFLQPLGVALEFEGGSTTLLTARGELLDAWRDAGPAPALLYGAIAGAGAGAGDSDALLDGRLDRVVATVESETPEYPGAAFDVLGRVPSWISAGTTDGVVILLTTRAGAATECQEVFLVRDSRESRAAMGIFLQQGGTRANLEQFAEPVGEVRYQPGTTTVVGGTLEQLVEDWGAREPGSPLNAVYLTPAGESETELRERHEQRARGVLNGLGAQVDLGAFGLPAGVSDCDSVLLIVAGGEDQTEVPTATVRHRVIEVDSANMQQQLAKAMSAGQGDSMLRQLGGEVRPLGYVLFDAGTSNVRQETLDTVVAASGGGGSPDQPLLVTPAKATQVEADQAEVIRGALAVTVPAGQVVAPLAGSESVYGDARAVTLVVPG